MNNSTIKWLIAAISGAVAAFFGQYGLFFTLVGTIIVLDVTTGLIRAKVTDEGLSSKKASKGFWKKISLFVGLLFGIFLDFAVAAVLTKTGINVGLTMPFSLIVCAYIIINEGISVSENLYLINPDIFPPQIGKFLKVAKKQMDNKTDIDPKSESEGEEDERESE